MHSIRDGRLKVFIGYDPREDAAYQVCRHSLLRHASIPIEVSPLRQQDLRERGLYTRADDPNASTEFSLTRFLTPYLAVSAGLSMFVDCDFLFTKDIGEMVRGLDAERAVHVVRHDYVPCHAVKMDGRPQATYPRKNWSSLMIFNGSHAAVRALGPEVVNRASASFLHRLEWVRDELIGGLPSDWNFLVGDYEPTLALPAGIHFTNGGPWFANCQHFDYAELWRAEHDAVLSQMDVMPARTGHP